MGVRGVQSQLFEFDGGLEEIVIAFRLGFCLDPVFAPDIDAVAANKDGSRLRICQDGRLD